MSEPTVPPDDDKVAETDGVAVDVQTEESEESEEESTKSGQWRSFGSIA